MDGCMNAFGMGGLKGMGCIGINGWAWINWMALGWIGIDELWWVYWFMNPPITFVQSLCDCHIKTTLKVVLAHTSLVCYVKHAEFCYKDLADIVPAVALLALSPPKCKNLLLLCLSAFPSLFSHINHLLSVLGVLHRRVCTPHSKS